MWLRNLAFCAFLTLGCLHDSLGENYATSFPVEHGAYAVGLKVVEQYDRGRAFGPEAGKIDPTVKNEHPRPLQTLVWYPAQKTTRPAMTMGDYLALMATQVSFGAPQKTRDQDLLQTWLQSSAGQSLLAVRDAPIREGRYPVVVYAPSFSSMAWENTDLCEYLASYGYVVLASPGMGEKSLESTHDLAGVDAQARDVSFLITYAGTLPGTDMTRIAAIGFSWGGLSNLFAASRDERIKALVSLDGSERYFPGLVKASGTVHPDQMSIPLLYFEEGNQSLEDQDRLNSRFHADGPSVLNQWVRGDLITIRMLGLFHPEFCSIAYRNAELWEHELPNLQIADYDRADGLVGYSWVMRYTKAFLDSYLNNDTAAATFLKAQPGMNGVPNHTMSIKLKRSTPVANGPSSR
jgi:pimeloyl-ACP methyl ester carboxylesterase